ncbi:MAG TPA: SseB family protein [Streptosporangiaceae bacterium]|nr:SseB family protein [Streptosporangiaceae bacterium]
MRSRDATEPGPEFPGDDGAADPAVLAALTAYAAGRGSEHAALTALAGSRVLVPVVAVLAEGADAGHAAAGASAVPGSGLRREKTTEMALPTLIGRDGRAAILAFTSLDALTRWRPDARPVAVPAARAWQAAVQEASAVVIDVAGPVPVTLEGARLAALAAGRPVPLPHQDPDVLAALHAVLGTEPLITQASLTTPGQRAGWEYGPRPEDLPDLAGPGVAELSALGLDPPRPDGAAAGPAAQGGASRGSTPETGPAPSRAGHDGAGQDAAGHDPGGHDPAGHDAAGQDCADLALQVTLADDCAPDAATAAVRRVAEALLTATGGRLRRGLQVSVAPPRRAR